MTRINFNALSKLASTRGSVAWGKNQTNNFANTISKNTGALIFAALLIVCSVTVGCSSDKPKPISSNQTPMAQNPIPDTIATSTPPAVPSATEKKPAPKKVVRKRPATVNYSDKTYGVSFDYPRRYALETGKAANDLVASSAFPMNFVQPGGVALAAVELPETGFADTDFSYAYFNVSVNNAVSAEQCGEFAAPQQPNSTAASQPVGSSSEATTNAATEPKTELKTEAASETATASPTKPALDPGKLMIGDLEFQGTETVMGEGTRQSDAKYFHVFQNGACYEFALNVTTSATPSEVAMKHVDRDKVFARLEKILSTVKINATKTDQAKTDQAKTDQAKIDQAKTDQLKTDQVKTDDVKASPQPAPEITASTPATAETPAAPVNTPQ